MTIATLTSPTVDGYPDVTTTTEMDAKLADITNKLNEVIALVNGLENPAATDLSGYTTTGQLTAHKVGHDHIGMVEADAALTGRRVLLQKKTGTMSGASTAITWDTSYATGAILFAWVSNSTSTPTAIGVSAYTTTGATIKGTDTNTFTAYAVGYI